jgi:hypothetical protein
MKIDLLTVVENDGVLILKRKRGDLTIYAHLTTDYMQNHKVGQIVSLDVHLVSGSKFVLSKGAFVNKYNGQVELIFSNGYSIGYEPGYFDMDSGERVMIWDHLKHLEKGDSIKITIT